jgi:hypothetical protein
MAVQQGYGKMAGANSLVFAYDSTDTTNSFKGRPTVNQFLHHGTSGKGAAADNFVNFPTQGTTGFKRLGYGQTFGGYTIKPEDVVYYYDKVDLVSCHYHGNVASVPVGAYVVFSFDFYLSPTITVENGSLANIENYGNGALSGGITGVNSSTEKGVWHRRVQVFGPKGGTVAGSQAMFLYPGGCSARLSSTPGYILYKNPQVEFVNFTTESPFVQGTRSNTQSILDLTGNHTVDVSTLDFSNGFELDGTSDHMTFNLTKTPNMTFEFITNYSGPLLPDSEMVFNAGNGSQGPDLYLACGKLNWNIWDGCNNPFANIPRSWSNGKNHHVVLVNDQTNSIAKIYYDGTLLGTATYRQCTADNMSIGGNSTGYNYRGNLPVFKVYSEALTEAQVLSNFNNYRKRFEGLDYYIDDTTDGGGWIRWWWYTGVGWPGHETEALGHPFGTFDSSSHYGFQRLPEGLNKDNVELLAKDGDGNILKWDFASPSVIAQHVWDSFTQGTQGTWRQDGDPFNPEVIAGGKPNPDQDAWKYRVSEGVASFLLDDDGCDCQSTLNAGHAMCGGSWVQQYAQPDGAYLRYGVDTLNDGGCLGPLPERTLELYYRLK